MSRFPESLVKTYLTGAQTVFDLEIAALGAVRDQIDTEFVATVELLREVIHRQKKIVVTGVGKSGHVAGKISATLTSTGAPSLVLNAVNATHGDLGILGEGDAVLIISYSGETEELVRLLPSFKRLKVHVIAMTGKARSTIAQAADLHLSCRVEREACPLNLAPTASTTATLALGDALAMVLLEARGFNQDEFAKFHPGGTLGRNLLLKVQEIMRPLDRIAILPLTCTVNQALEELAEKRMGAAAVVDHSGKLVGIYTHGDFCRGYRSNVHIGQSLLSEVMTSNPITVRVDKLAVEVLNIFEEHSIDDLVVVNRQHHPVGLVDAQDLAKHKLL